MKGGPVVVVTGATGGLGSALAARCMPLIGGGLDGMALVCRNPERMLGLPDLLSSGSIRVVQHDASVPGESYSTLTDVLCAMKATEVTCIHTAFAIAPIGHMGFLRNDQVIDNVNCNVADLSLLLNQLIGYSSNSGARLRFVNIDSGAAYKPVDGWAMYCSSKAFANQMLRCCVSEGSLDAVTYEPGVMDTKMQEGIRAARPDECSAVEGFRRLHDEGKLNSPAAVADDIVRRFVLSWDGASFEVGFRI